jgi:hypothetical protein
VKYTFTPLEDGCVDVTEPGGALVCWLPGGVAAELERSYAAQREIDWVVANQWMAGALVGLHMALGFANQMPEVLMTIRRGMTEYEMVGDGR